MKQISKTLKTAVIIGMVSIAGCTSAQTTENAPQESEQDRPERRERPSPEEMFTKMDANKDGKLEATEVRGPLKEDFAKIDTDGDGFITREELEKAPKPERRRKPRE